MPRSPRPKTQVITFRVTESVWEMLRAIAETELDEMKQPLSVSALARRLMQKELDRRNAQSGLTTVSGQKKKSR